jgi:hypothetical protein
MALYLLSVYQPDGPIPPPEVLGPVMEEIAAMNRELQASGNWVFAGGLHPPSTATVVRVTSGDTLMTDGPFTEGKEHLGGFTIIRAPDLDVASNGTPAGEGDDAAGGSAPVSGDGAA